MKRSKYHIVHAWVLLFCFIAGQYVVYAHQHIIKPDNSTAYKNSKQAKQTIKEKCQLCDAMHHTTMLLVQNSFYTPNIPVNHVYQTDNYSFISVSLILSSGRAPPTVS